MPTTHLVLPGETLYRIGLQHGVDPAGIRKLNELPNDTIFAGQTLLVKEDTLVTTYAIRLRQAQMQFVWSRAHLINFARDPANGYAGLTAGEAYRWPATQKEHFDAGRSQTMNSMHLLRLADDYNIFVKLDGSLYLLFSDRTREDADLLLAKPLGDYWCSLHPDHRWGGDFDKDGNPLNGKFRDGGHFERYFK